MATLRLEHSHPLLTLLLLYNLCDVAELKSKEKS